MRRRQVVRPVDQVEEGKHHWKNTPRHSVDVLGRESPLMHAEQLDLPGGNFALERWQVVADHCRRGRFAIVGIVVTELLHLLHDKHANDVHVYNVILYRPRHVTSRARATRESISRHFVPVVTHVRQIEPTETSVGFYTFSSARRVTQWIVCDLKSDFREILSRHWMRLNDFISTALKSPNTHVNQMQNLPKNVEFSP